MRVTVSGRVFVLGADGVEISDPAVLQRFDDVVYDEEAFTEYFGGSDPAYLERLRQLAPDDETMKQTIRRGELENALRAALDPGGSLHLVYRREANQLWVVTEYSSKRELSPTELEFLADYTTGQWSDGIGENFESLSKARYGYTIDCFRRADGYNPLHPVVEQR
jgi:hypothetical protein